MKKTIYALAAVAIAVVVVAAALLYQPGNTVLAKYSYGFENGFDNWTTGSDVPDNPNNPGHPVNWTIQIVGNMSHAGNHSLQLYIDGSQDDGTIWVTRRLALEPNTSRNVTVSFEFWSPSESFNTMANVVGYIGTKNATSEGSFQSLGAANQVAGWRTYTFTSNVETGSSGDVNVAVGISVVWETQMTYYIDDVAIN